MGCKREGAQLNVCSSDKVGDNYELPNGKEWKRFRFLSRRLIFNWMLISLILSPNETMSILCLAGNFPLLVLRALAEATRAYDRLLVGCFHRFRFTAEAAAEAPRMTRYLKVC